jgi:hypothetical protein
MYELCSYDSCCKTLVIKHAEQTGNCEAARKYSVSWGKHPKVEITETGNYAKKCMLSYKRQEMRRCGWNVDRIGRQHLPTTVFDTESKTMHKAQLPVGLIIRYHTKGWILISVLNWKSHSRTCLLVVVLVQSTERKSIKLISEFVWLLFLKWLYHFPNIQICLLLLSLHHVT